MTTTGRLLGTAALTACLAGTQAHAAGTIVGTAITNTATMNFQVGGIAQAVKSASNTAIVDRAVNLTLVNVGATTQVNPGQTGAVTTWTVTNLSNDTLDFALSTVNQNSGVNTQHGGTDAANIANVRYYADSNANGVYDPGDDAQITCVDELGPDSSRTVFVAADMPNTATNGQVAGVVLTVSAEMGGVVGTQGYVMGKTTGANTSGIDNVFADGAGIADSAADGRFSAAGDYTVAAAIVSFTKSLLVISDPINGTTNPKLIPGSVVEYCLAVSNAAGAAPATGIVLSDVLPGTVTYSPGSIFLDTTVTGTACSAGTAASDATGYNAGSRTISGPLSDLAAGAAGGLRFRVTVN